MKSKIKEVTNNLVSKKSKKTKVKNEKELALEKLKFEVAKEIGLFDKVKEEGWASLTAQETGRIGGIMNSRRKRNQRWVLWLLLVLFRFKKPILFLYVCRLS